MTPDAAVPAVAAAVARDAAVPAVAAAVTPDAAVPAVAAEHGGAQREPRFWIDTVSLDHVLTAVAGGFTQADHGANTRLRRMRAGDGMIFYSPRTALTGGRPLQQFTAIGEVTGTEPYQITLADDFRPWRLSVRYNDSRPVDAKPLAPELSFIADPAHWGLPFRRGLFTIPERDFRTIAAALRP